MDKEAQTVVGAAYFNQLQKMNTAREAVEKQVTGIISSEPKDTL